MVYKTWAFRLFVYVVIANILVAYFVIQSTVFSDYTRPLVFLGFTATAFTIIGIILGVISFSKKEKNDYQKYLGLFGNVFFLLMGLVPYNYVIF